MKLINTRLHINKPAKILISLGLYLLSPMIVSASNIIDLDVKTVTVNKYNMSYVEQGKGSPLILVHGSLSDFRTWLPLFEELSETNRTIAVSLRHFYPEKWDGKDNDLSLGQHANDLAAFIRTIDNGPVSLLGHSRGAAVAMLVASKHPALIDKLILADPTPLASILPDSSDIQSGLNQRRQTIQEVMKQYKTGNIDGGLEVFVNYVAGPNAWEKTSQTRRSSLRSNALTQSSLLNDINTPFNCNTAKKITAPVLLIAGDRSRKFYINMHKALKPCLKNVSNAVIADAGHMMFHANPTAFVFEVQDFILPQ